MVQAFASPGRLPDALQRSAVQMIRIECKASRIVNQNSEILFMVASC